MAELESLRDDSLSDLNGALERKKLDPLRPMTQEEWEKKKEEGG